MKKIILLTLLSILVSCGQEILAPGTISEGFDATDLQSFQLNTCSQMRFEKPPVDILFLVDNSGSSLLQSFNNIKQQIRNTINTVSTEFDYHIYIAPLLPLPGDTTTGYQLLLSDPSTIPSLASVNTVTPENISLFSQATGNNDEPGISRATSLISANRTNGIFRSRANTIIVTISNGDDTGSYASAGNGNFAVSENKFSQLKTSLLELTKKYSDQNTVSNPLEAESFRYLSLVAHTNCNGWRPGSIYKRMSNEVYSYMGSNDDSISKNSYDLCSANYSNLFTAVNNSIRAVVIGHQYDHWKISNASASSIQEDDITLTKVSASGSITNLARSSTNGFEYLGFQNNINTRFSPTPGEPATGLVVKLNGTARVSYPDCIIAKTRTPTEYFGFLALPREPQSGTIKVVIRGQEVSQSITNGWSYIGWTESRNIKVPGPTNASITPALFRSGYFIQLNGSAIFTNGDSIEIFYKPASL